MSSLESNVFYVKAKYILHSCPDCGNPVPLDNVTIDAKCPECSSQFKIPPSLWRKGLGFVDNVDWLIIKRPPGAEKKIKKQTREVKSEGFSLRMEYDKASPQCIYCGQPLQITGDQAMGEANFTIPCSGCGKENVFTASPPWLKELYPQIVHIDSKENVEPGSEGGQKAGKLASETKGPVLMACPNCNGQLNITKETKRISKCEFCGASIYLPEDIWRNFHPVKKASAWLARLKVSSARFRKEAVSKLWISLIGVLWFGGAVGFVYGGIEMWKQGTKIGGIIFGSIGVIVFGLPGLVIIIGMIVNAFQYFGYASRFRE